MGTIPQTQTVAELRRELIEDVAFDLQFPHIKELSEEPMAQELYVDSQLLRVAL
jgi:hypothetical protein